MPDAIDVPSADPAVPNDGIGPSPRIRMMFSTMFSTVIVSPSRSGVRASPAARSAADNMKNSSMPRLKTKLIRRNGSACALHLRRGVHEVEQHRREEISDGAHHDEHADRREERLLHHFVHAIGITGAGEARHEDRLAGEERRDEDDDDEEDLPADADGGVGGRSRATVRPGRDR